MKKLKEIEKEGNFTFTMGGFKGLIEYKNGIISIYELGVVSNEIVEQIEITEKTKEVIIMEKIEVECSKCGRILVYEDDVIQVRQGYIEEDGDFAPSEDLEWKHVCCPVDYKERISPGHTECNTIINSIQCVGRLYLTNDNRKPGELKYKCEKCGRYWKEKPEEKLPEEIIYDTLHGSTPGSRKFIKEHYYNIVNIKYVECKKYDILWSELVKRGQVDAKDLVDLNIKTNEIHKEYLSTRIVCKDRIYETTGFSWGYAGEGCAGLREMLVKLGFLEIAKIDERKLRHWIAIVSHSDNIRFMFKDGTLLREVDSDWVKLGG